MTPKNIVLIGFMGSGKTLISKELEKILGRRRVSTDDLIEKQEHMTIPQIFSTKGEAYFRALEEDIIKDVSGKAGLIIDCGGGVVLNPKNVKNLKTQGILINLSITADSVLKNIAGGAHRPLLNVPDPRTKVEELLKARESYYTQADYSVVVDGKPLDTLTQDVLKVIKNVEP